jgi:hypothetical protein
MLPLCTGWHQPTAAAAPLLCAWQDCSCKGAVQVSEGGGSSRCGREREGVKAVPAFVRMQNIHASTSRNKAAWVNDWAMVEGGQQSHKHRRS